MSRSRVLLLTIFGLFACYLTGSLSSNNRLDNLLKELKFQGSILVAKRGQILLNKGYGEANKEHKIPNTPKTVFRIASLSKQFAAVAILQLQQKGLLQVKDPIKKFLPDYPEGEKITVHHLLSHTSGIFNLCDLAEFKNFQSFEHTLEQVIARFKYLPLKFEPGTDCEYCDSGYIILGAILEIVTGQYYADYIAQHIFGPLKMHDSYFECNHRIISNRASGYDLNGNHAKYIDMSIPHAAGALSSTVEDLYKWDQALAKAVLLNQENSLELFKSQGINQRKKINYGYGFRIGPENEGLENGPTTIRGHYGAIEGFKSVYIYEPKEELTVILLSNSEASDLEELYKLILKQLKEDL